MYLGSLVPGYQVYKRRRGATRISLDSSESYQLPTKTHSRATSLPTKYQAAYTGLCTGLCEELACTSANRKHAETRLTGQPRMLAKGGATACSLELIRAGTRHALAAMAHLAVLETS